MGRSLQRLNQIAKPNDFNDQKSAAEIISSESTSNDYAEFQEFILSQIKRILYGNFPGNWNDDSAQLIIHSYEFPQEHILESETVIVGENRQYINYNRIINDGRVICDGQGVTIENG